MTNNIDGVSIDALTKTYLKIKAKRSALKADFDEADGKLKTQQESIKRALLDYCKENEVESVRTNSGLVYRSLKTRYWTSDWDAIHKFVLEHEVPQLFAKSLNQTNVRQFLEDNPDLVPAGLNVDSEYSISVRKA